MALFSTIVTYLRSSLIRLSISAWTCYDGAQYTWWSLYFVVFDIHESVDPMDFLVRAFQQVGDLHHHHGDDLLVTLRYHELLGGYPCDVFYQPSPILYCYAQGFRPVLLLHNKFDGSVELLQMAFGSGRIHLPWLTTGLNHRQIEPFDRLYL